MHKKGDASNEGIASTVHHATTIKPQPLSMDYERAPQAVDVLRDFLMNPVPNIHSYIL